MVYTFYFKSKNLKIISLVIAFLLFICAFICKDYFNFSLSKLAQPVDAKVESVKIPIVMYHSIIKSKKSLGKFVISPEEFESDLKYLKDNNFNTIFMKDILDYVYEDKNLPENPIMLTFDDGYYNNYLYAYPLLKDYSFKMVISPIGIEVDKYSEIENHSPNYAHVSWSNLKEMIDSGLVEVQNHTYNMHKINKKRRGTKKNKNESMEKYKSELSNDLLLMQNKICDNLGVSANTFVYPFGAISNCSVDIIKNLGFKASFGCEGKINSITKNPDDLYGLCRIIIPSGVNLESLLKKLC